MEITEKMVRVFALDILFFHHTDYDYGDVEDIRETAIQQMEKALSFFHENGISFGDKLELEKSDIT